MDNFKFKIKYVWIILGYKCGIIKIIMMFRTLIFMDWKIGQLELSVHNFDPGCSMQQS